jgi:RNA polymerase sigma-70 factor (ECF subfamily)
MTEHRGSRLQLEQIYRQYRQGLFTLALSVTGCPARAEDAIQDAFERMCRTRPGCEGEEISAGYVFAAVRNAARDQRRRLRLAEELPVSIFDDRPTPEARAEADESAEVLRKCLQELDEDSREVVVMKIYAGLTFDEIAKAMSEPLQTVASRYRRALQRLKDRLGSCV